MTCEELVWEDECGDEITESEKERLVLIRFLAQYAIWRGGASLVHSSSKAQLFGTSTPSQAWRFISRAAHS